MAARTEHPGKIMAELQELLEKAEDLCNRCSKQSHVAGINKLRKKCQAEQKFLLRIIEKGHVKKAHLVSSNLSHLEGVVDAVERLPNVTKTLQPFSLPGWEHPLCVDVVCNHGFTWVKVIARKAQALQLVWAGEGQFGEKSIVDQAAHYLECSRSWPVNFSQPKIVMIFLNGITKDLNDRLTDLGISVQGRVEEQIDSAVSTPCCDTTLNVEECCSDYGAACDEVNVEEELVSAAEYIKKLKSASVDDIRRVSLKHSEGTCSWKSETVDNIGATQNNNCTEDTGNARGGCDESSIPTEDVTELCASQAYEGPAFTSQPCIKRCNLDITTLICLVSNLCHGNTSHVFNEDILNKQASEERTTPLMPSLKSFLQDKELYVCSTAIEDFKSILDTIGGPCEKERASDILRRVHLVPDCPTQRAIDLQTSAKVKDRAKIIFGTGESLKAITTSANAAFVRAANNQGVKFAVHLHGSRALTEQKEGTATPFLE